MTDAGSLRAHVQPASQADPPASQFDRCIDCVHATAPLMCFCL
jgi:hypothetical protein